MRNLFIIVFTLFSFFVKASISVDSTIILTTPLSMEEASFSRKGLFGSIGIGRGVVKEKLIYTEVEVASENYQFLGIELTGGFGLTEKITSFFTIKNNFYTLKESKEEIKSTTYNFTENNFFTLEESKEEKKSTTYNFTGIGISYFLQSKEKTPFISIGIGTVSHTPYFIKGIITGKLGFFLGAGYSVNEKIYIKVETILGKPNIDVNSKDLSLNTMSIGLSANYSF